ncbi:ribosome maturation factor RimM [Homoserinibacter sp. GY 40078]|uniref:ribosome maturation factor RimM n=1 Tax=Homoserinibacter sp. GY 40078 TaxID=2603275 RepID=UPI0021085109|nr:ribosome maturation factor RimM [Homoserinibacter sp. GY 40078]
MSRGKRSGTTQLRVGRLVKAHGLKGALKLELYTDDPAKRFVPGATFSLQVPSSSPWHGKTIELSELRWYNGHPVAFFVDVADRTAAETLVKAILWVDADVSDDDEPDAWYDHQLVGLRAMRDGVEVGTVIRVDHLPAQDLLVVRAGEREVLVPLVAAIVPGVDIDGGTVTLTPPPGLFEDLAEPDPEPAPAAAAASDLAPEPAPDSPGEDDAPTQA